MCDRGVPVMPLSTAGTNERSALNHNIYVRMMWNNGTYVNSYPNGPFWTAFWGAFDAIPAHG